MKEKTKKFEYLLYEDISQSKTTFFNVFEILNYNFVVFLWNYNFVVRTFPKS